MDPALDSITLGTKPIGIDVEEKKQKPRNNIMSFAQRYFTPCEFNFLHAVRDLEIQRQEVIKLWILKVRDLEIQRQEV
ncbi:hypothetical protein QJS10_CPA05g01804 [Acorus calamus]|uniref:Uncharacterized protein n=1 Tax=Acorus calamus TaxID=4465 RepID=A0AAV9EW84_ACOCL|nr:hypothetical protein QJS10_CPA05g01804 [Acorus calamus]